MSLISALRWAVQAGRASLTRRRRPDGLLDVWRGADGLAGEIYRGAIRTDKALNLQTGRQIEVAARALHAAAAAVVAARCRHETFATLPSALALEAAGRRLEQAEACFDLAQKTRGRFETEMARRYGRDWRRDLDDRPSVGLPQGPSGSSRPASPGDSGASLLAGQRPPVTRAPDQPRAWTSMM